MSSQLPENPIIAVIGLGYVGLPLALAFANKCEVMGFDLNTQRINELQNGIDVTEEADAQVLKSTSLQFTGELQAIKAANVYIVTVPTPVDQFKRPDLTPLIKASEMLGEVVGKGDVVIYESTVYPGATEEDCLPVIERVSGLTLNQDFYAGYSPERINPGDKTNKLESIKKVTSGSSKEAADFVDKLYNRIIKAGTHKARSIKVAEASKVIENTQRDINIAVVNEFAQIFNSLGIDTTDVLEAAGTKWNFLPFKPGLVGGHCIGVDPYYLSHKSQSTGYIPDILLAGRRINDEMGRYIANQVMAIMVQKRLHINGGKVLILGATFKENCPDIRNTKVMDIATTFEAVGAEVDFCDPWVSGDDMQKRHGIELVKTPDYSQYDAVILAVAHEQFLAQGSEAIRGKMKQGAVLYDVKAVLDKKYVDGRL